MKHRLPECISASATPSIHFHLDMIGLYDNHPHFPQPGLPLTREQGLIVLSQVKTFVGFGRADGLASEPVPSQATGFEMLAEAARLVSNIECELDWDKLARKKGEVHAEKLRGPDNTEITVRFSTFNEEMFRQGSGIHDEICRRLRMFRKVAISLAPDEGHLPAEDTWQVIGPAHEVRAFVCDLLGYIDFDAALTEEQFTII